MKRIVNLIICMLALSVQAQDKNFYQTIDTHVVCIEVDSNVQRLLVFVDSTVKENKIIVSNIKNVQQFAKVKHDTLIISELKKQSSGKQPVISVYLKQYPNALTVGKNAQIVVANLNETTVQYFDVKADANSQIAFSMIYPVVFDSLTVNQSAYSEIYFSFLSVRKNFYLKTHNATFQSNDTDLDENVKQTVLSHGSTVKVKGFAIR